MSTQQLLIEDHLGIIASFSLYYWRLLPPQVQAYFDGDDMISEVVLQVLSKVNKFDPARSRPSTFVWRVTENHCRTILARYRRPQYAPDPLPLESESPKTYTAPPDRSIRVLEALSNVERVFVDAQYLDDVGDGLDALFRRKPCYWTTDMKKEFRKLVQKHNVHYDDFRLVLVGA